MVNIFYFSGNSVFFNGAEWVFLIFAVINAVALIWFFCHILNEWRADSAKSVIFPRITEPRIIAPKKLARFWKKNKNWIIPTSVMAFSLVVLIAAAKRR